jgi:hypothetical protein
MPAYPGYIGEQVVIGDGDLQSATKQGQEPRGDVRDQLSDVPVERDHPSAAAVEVVGIGNVRAEHHGRPTAQRLPTLGNKEGLVFAAQAPKVGPQEVHDPLIGYEVLTIEAPESDAFNPR